MTTFNTMNPIPSADARDRYDNSQVFDQLMNGAAPNTPDRLGVLRQSWAGMEQAFNQFLIDSGFEPNHLTYVDGAPLQVDRPTQLIDRADSVYRIKMPANFPVTLTGTWATDQIQLVDVGDQSLRTELASPTGAELVYNGAETVADQLNRTKGVDSVYALLSAPTGTSFSVQVASYHTGWAATLNGAIGGGRFTWVAGKAKSTHDGGNVISPTVPWDGTQAGLSAFLNGTGETQPAGNGCWVRTDLTSHVEAYGARRDNTSDDTASFQKCLDKRHLAQCSDGTYLLAGTLLYKANGYRIHGQSMTDTVLNFTGAGNKIRNDAASTTTRLFCEIRDVKLVAASMGANYLVDWKSMQHGAIDRVWFLGQAIAGSRMLNMEAIWPTGVPGDPSTECTYNNITRCYFGLMGIGIAIGDGANNNNIIGNRFQPTLSSSIGVFLSATSPGRVSVINIIGNGFEFPGAISTGINILQNCDGVWLYGNRFEQLNNGVVVGLTGNKHIYGANRESNYFESCNLPVNRNAGARSAKPGLVASGCYTATGSIAEIDGYGMTAVRTGVGVYAFTYLDTTYPDAAQTITVTTNAPVNVVAKTATGFTLTAQNTSGVNIDVATINASVYYGR